MTTIIAMKNKKTNEISLCHDGKLTASNEVYSNNTDKLIKYTHFALMLCGSNHIQTVLRHKHKTTFNDILIEDEEDVLAFFQLYHDKVLNDPMLAIGDSKDEKRHIADFIIVTKDKIFSMNNLGEIGQPDLVNKEYKDIIELYVEGSGSEVARNYIEGYLSSYKNVTMDQITMSHVIKLAAEYAGEKITSCNKNITIYTAKKLFE